MQQFLHLWAVPPECTGAVGKQKPPTMKGSGTIKLQEGNKEKRKREEQVVALAEQRESVPVLLWRVEVGWVRPVGSRVLLAVRQRGDCPPVAAGCLGRVVVWLSAVLAASAGIAPSRSISHFHPAPSFSVPLPWCWWHWCWWHWCCLVCNPQENRQH